MRVAGLLLAIAGAASAVTFQKEWPIADVSAIAHDGTPVGSEIVRGNRELLFQLAPDQLSGDEC